MSHRFTPTLTTLAVAAIASMLGSSSAFAAGFALQENSGSGLGNAYAGGAAAAEDAATLWSNAAGMARLGKGQFVGVVNLIRPSINFSNANSLAAANQPLGDEGGDAGGWNVVPNLYLTYPINPQWSVGIGVNAPFGLVTEYDPTWIGRFQGVKSEIETINVNPAVSWKPTDNVAVGFGANYQHIEAVFTSKVNYSGALLKAAALNGIAPGSPNFNAIAAATPGLQSDVEVRGTDYTWGWNLGVLIDIDKASRLGAQYRSGMKYTVNGNVTFSNPALPPLPSPIAPIVGALANGVNTQMLYDSGVTSTIKLPEIVNVSYFRTLDPRWDIMADVQYTGWSSIQTLTFVRSDGNELQNTVESFRDAWRFALGANYRTNERWMLRGGLAYDQSPVRDADRTVRLPDADRTWLTLGAQYKANSSLWLDFGFAYVWVKRGNIDSMGSTNLDSPPNVPQNGLVNGSYSNNVVVLSGQITYAF